MKIFILPFCIIILSLQKIIAQDYLPVIEPCPCLIKVDTGLVTKCGYLVVPENRKKPAGRKIKIPFVFIPWPVSHRPEPALEYIHVMRKYAELIPPTFIK